MPSVLDVTIKPGILSLVKLSITVLSFIMLSVIMMGVLMLSVLALILRLTGDFQLIHNTSESSLVQVERMGVRERERKREGERKTERRRERKGERKEGQIHNAFIIFKSKPVDVS
jgi:hypothetical protein